MIKWHISLNQWSKALTQSTGPDSVMPLGTERGILISVLFCSALEANSARFNDPVATDNCLFFGSRFNPWTRVSIIKGWYKRSISQKINNKGIKPKWLLAKGISGYLWSVSCEFKSL